MKPKVFSVTSVQQIEAYLHGIHSEGLTPTLAIVFSSVVHNLRELSAIFSKFNIDVFGASSSGEITNDEVHEESIVVMLLDINRDAFRLNIFDGEGKTSYQVGQKVAEWAKTVYDNPPLMVMSAGLHADGEQIVNGINNMTDGKTPVFGCFAAFDPTSISGVPDTFVFDSSQLCSNGVIALILDPNVIEVGGTAASGWKGIGTPKTITKAAGNIVYTIDNEPALDVVNKYLNIGDDPALATEYPLLWIREDGSSVMRAAMVINEDKSIVYGGTVPEGAKVRFGMSPGFEIIEHSIDQISKFRQQAPRGDAILLFSCRARHLALGPMVREEISAIRKLWDVPLVGFFTFGEIGPGVQGRSDFHNYTLVPVLIKEK
jgi:hypothetical protein